MTAKRSRPHRPRPVRTIPPILTGLPVSTGFVKSMGSAARREELRILLGTAERNSYAALAELFFVGHEVASVFNESDDIRTAVHEGIASLFRVEYSRDKGLEPLPEDIDSVRTAVDTALTAVSRSTVAEVLTAQARFDMSGEAHLANLRSFVRNALEASESVNRTAA